jgi:hypothetical protein
MPKPDIEPLSERQWSRIERDLFARVEQRAIEPAAAQTRGDAPPRWRTARVAVALVLAGAAAAIGGGVAVRWVTSAAPAHEVVASPSRITTDSAGSHLNVGEATLDVGPQSAVSVRGDDAHGVTLVLERGRVECEVPPRQGRPPFAVEAGDVVVRVVGTHFAVTRGVSSTEVEVQRGVVQITEGAERVDVHAGETWPAASPRPPLSAPAVQAPAPSPAAPTHDPTPSAPSGAAAVSTSSPNPRDRYAAASRLEATRPDQAIAIYQELAAKGGPWGMNALFAEGRLEADRGYPDDARRRLGEYLLRYPSGPNADDARQLVQRLR